jgi:hypothetical protein
MITGVAVVLMATGLVGMLRGVAIVATGGEGRFRSDHWVSLSAGFGLILCGQVLLRSQ